MHSVKVSKNGGRGPLNALTAKANHLEVETVQGRLQLNFDTWNLIYIILSRQLAKLTD